MSNDKFTMAHIEPLEARIAPAAVYPTIIDAEQDPSGSRFVTATVGTPIKLSAGDVLTTGNSPRSGSYLMFVEQGDALVFSTDFNNNSRLDYNEITGIAAGDGLRLISFVDIHGDIVTNLRPGHQLSDSDFNSANDDINLGGDGRRLLNSTIEKIEFRSLTVNDITDQNSDGFVDEADVTLRLVLTSYSHFGTIIAGKDFGVLNDDTSGLIVDDAGRTLLADAFAAGTTPFGASYYDDQLMLLKPRVGGVIVGSAASGEYFSFGYAKPGANDLLGDGTDASTGGRNSLRNGNDVQGTFSTFTPPVGQKGASIYNVRGATETVLFDIGQLLAGAGGVGAAGGDIVNVTLNGDESGGYKVIAGNGGSATKGAAGGSILNFSDLSSNTSEVIIRSGTGGSGNFGNGGAGGDVTFSSVNLLGAVIVDLGDGGAGYKAGGNGASLEKAEIVTPDRLIDNAHTIVGTTHDTPHNAENGRRIGYDAVDAGVIGRTGAIDFDGDGFGDIVVSTTNPSQLFVQFGDGFGGYRIDPVTLRPDRVYLDAPLDAKAVTVGDFDGDGNWDIAAASNRQGNFGGLVVYLSKYEDNNRDGILSGTEDSDGDGFNDLLGFRTARYSSIPHISDSFGVLDSPNAVSDIEAGDFNGDGFTDLAVTATYYDSVTLAPFQGLIFMYSDVENGLPTGQFFADFGTKGQSVPPVSQNLFTPLVFVSPGLEANIEVTALSAFEPYDVVVALAGAGNDRGFLQIYDNSFPSINGPIPRGTISFGSVDSNRLMPELDDNGNVTNRNISTVPNIKGRDFTILDFDNDRVADFTALIEEPAGFLVSFRGDGSGGGSRLDGSVGASNSGFFFGSPANGVGGADIETDQLRIRAVDTNGDGVLDGVAVLMNRGSNIFQSVYEMVIGDPADGVGTVDNPGGALNGVAYSFASANSDVFAAFDIFYADVNNLTLNQYGHGDPESIDIPLVGNVLLAFGDIGIGFVELTERFMTFNAGDGGEALVGRGGTGGSLGSGGINQSTGLGSLDVKTNFGIINFYAGNGGNGFTSGGAGGSLLGILVDGATSGALVPVLDANLYAGTGGIGVSGRGGNGGSIVAPSVLLGTNFVAGDGGRGIIGGTGGSISGNGIVDLYDVQSLDHFLTAGNGGNGIKRGGDGGNILDFHASLDVSRTPESGTIIYLGGNGGIAVSGRGGNGGNIIDTSPLDFDQNQLAGDITMIGGRGGDGLKGGNGGSVRDFINLTDQSQPPALVTFLGGDGGRGTKGNGGSGGDVSNINTTTTGAVNANVLFPGTTFTFDRVIGGRGGDSAGAKGGSGGDVSRIKLGGIVGAAAIVAGAGGDGLFVGGKGGNVNTISIELGADADTKALIAAGQGGDANAYIALGNDPASLQTAIKAYGGRIGKGGNGGSIANVQQSGNPSARMDFIAGNGGDTVNFGISGLFNKFVGKGGSIGNINLAGKIGNFDLATPIKSYNDIRSGETMDDFVRQNLRDETAPGSISDAVGNVGLVVGAAGRIKAVFGGYDGENQAIYPSRPAEGGVNGSISNIRSSGILAAVAGSVERIATIRSASGIVGPTASSDFLVGQDKPGSISYISPTGAPIPTPVIDGILVNGAMVLAAPAKKSPLLPTDFVFVLA